MLDPPGDPELLVSLIRLTPLITAGHHHAWPALSPGPATVTTTLRVVRTVLAAPAPDGVCRRLPTTSTEVRAPRARASSAVTGTASTSCTVWSVIATSTRAWSSLPGAPRMGLLHAAPAGCRPDVRASGVVRCGGGDPAHRDHPAGSSGGWSGRAAPRPVTLLHLGPQVWLQRNAHRPHRQNASWTTLSRWRVRRG